ncbi:MAG: hypothetical protein AAFN77_07860 [Planctomycetota bacterium]
MSTVFLVVAVMVGASDRNWKEDAEKLRQRAVNAEEAAKQVRSSTSKMQKKLESEMVARTLQIANLESQLRQLNLQRTALEKDLDTANKLQQAQLAELETAQNRIAQLDTELDGLKANNKQLVDDIALQFQSVRNLQNQLFTADNEITSLTATRSRLAADLAKYEKLKSKLGFDENSLLDHIPPKVESVVSKTYQGGLFEIELGEDDGIRIGHEMDVFRRRQFVGKGRVVKTNHNNAVLQVIEGMMNGQVQEGDSVSTKL